MYLEHRIGSGNYEKIQYDLKLLDDTTAGDNFSRESRKIILDYVRLVRGTSEPASEQSTLFTLAKVSQ